MEDNGTKIREILFRGERRDGGGWLVGDLQTVAHKYYIDGMKARARVKPETVGQFTGLIDKNERRIFEGDILEVEFKDGTTHRGLVLFVDEVAAFRVCYDEDIYGDVLNGIEAQTLYEIIGNIHDTPGLLNYKRRDKT